MREDMILKTCVGRLPQNGAELASQPTMSRLENAIGIKELYLIGRQFVESFISSYAQSSKGIILDCDDTNNNTYGQQELNFITIFMVNIVTYPCTFIKVFPENW